jgi:hypothetical protein
MILKLLILIILIPLGIFVVYLYLVYQSFFSIFSTGSGLFTVINQVGIDLGNSVPIPTEQDPPETLFQKAKRLIVNSTLKITIISIFIWAMAENYKWTKELNQKNEPYKVLLIISLLFLLMIVGVMAYILIKIVTNTMGIDLLNLMNISSGGDVW